MPEMIPIIDLHCDLTSYLSEEKGAHHARTEDIGCATPYLEEGNVKVQVLAVYSPTAPGSAAYAAKQMAVFDSLKNEGVMAVADAPKKINDALAEKGTRMLMSIENASGLCEEDEPLAHAFERLGQFEKTAGRLFYIGFTHHPENRFGGGNKSEAGLKPDGMALLDFLHGKRIAVDFSHASDALAFGILDYIDKQRLDIPVLASHSNFREVWDHNRNLPAELSQEIVRRKGLIGMNFLREYVDREKPEALETHILLGLQKAPDSLAFGADYFYVKDFYDTSRVPLYFPRHEDARSYQPLLANLTQQGVTSQQLDALSWKNAAQFFERLWA